MNKQVLRRIAASLVPPVLVAIAATRIATATDPAPAGDPALAPEAAAPAPEPGFIGPPAPTPEGIDPADLAAGAEAARRATVEIVTARDGRRLALGTLVGVPPVVVTKASELEALAPGDLRLLLHDETLVEIARRTVDKANDLALLEPLAALPPGLAPVRSADPPALGALVLAPVPGASAQRVGVVGANSRAIEKRGGVLGVRLGFRRDGPGVAIEEIYPDSAAAQGGLEVGDRIVRVDDAPVPDSRELQQRIFSRDPGDAVTLGVVRGDATLDLTVTLGYWSDVFDLLERNQQMSGATSRRKTGFAAIIQHDIPLQPADVGGPLLDLEARMIGLNIARQDRVTSYALPGDLVTRVVASLREPEPQPEPGAEAVAAILAIGPPEEEPAPAAATGAAVPDPGAAPVPAAATAAGNESGE